MTLTKIEAAMPQEQPLARAEVVVASIIGKLVPHASFLSKIEPGALLSDLQLHPFDRAYTLSVELEERFGIEFSDVEVERWEFVNDVIQCVLGKQPADCLAA